MPRAIASITIAGDLDAVFERTNTINHWKEYFHDYTESVELSRERHGRFTMLTFRLTDNHRGTWESWRILDHHAHTAIAQRGEPEYPYRYMHLKWGYERVEDGVRLTVLHDFEMDPAAPYTNEQALESMEKHLSANLANIKRCVEAELGTAQEAEKLEGTYGHD